MEFQNHSLSFLFLIGFVLSLVHWIYHRLFSRHSLPPNLPWAGTRNRGASSRARSTLRSLFDTRGLLKESYTKYSKNGVTYVLPNVLTGPEVILPQSLMDWLLHQPDSVLDQGEVNRDFLQADFTMLHKKVVTDTVHKDVIQKELTRRLGDFTADVNEEIDFAFRKAWGVNTKDWTTVTAYDSMSEVITRISNRVLVGLPLCRNEDYLHYSSTFARFVVLEIVAPLVTLKDYCRYLAMTKHILPVWKCRTSESALDNKPKNDYVQWCLNHADDERDPEERGSDMITKRLAAISFAAIQSSVITSCNLLLDLAAFDKTEALLENIRRDIAAELGVGHRTWNKTSLSRIVLLDSTIRESMRLGGFVSRGVLKTVVAKDGVKLPGLSGVRLPYGSKVGIHAFPVHYDEDIYPEAQSFNPTRFCDDRSLEIKSEDASASQKQGQALVTTSSNFMAFSHGRHACPGRFFAAQQLKLVLAYIAMNYEIEPVAQRPANHWFVGSSGPPLETTIRIRRRESTV
ncbi:Cytochrome P450 [Glarea lozoyensis ATCC 20868]|uniref:Cytochrome P450 n=1 Tax=Glarea lozoyensis (strain ATCC 20868 / MF5171) TaxID=1116229 RepID=S3CQP8_GLAL2|nr:Cytochrome P450 [Glarea lozoyensis ATCC 20868]EPE27439.1 Cytochrome P450 [Glarea lozoyensis ATCC 20868]